MESGSLFASSSSSFQAETAGQDSQPTANVQTNQGASGNIEQEAETEQASFIQQLLSLIGLIAEPENPQNEPPLTTLPDTQDNRCVLHVSNWHATTETIVRFLPFVPPDLQLDSEDRFFTHKIHQNATLECLFELPEFYRSPVELYQVLRALLNGLPSLAISYYLLNEEVDSRVKKLKKQYGRRLKWKKVTIVGGCNIWTATDPSQRTLTYFRVNFKANQALFFVHTDTNLYKSACKSDQVTFAKAVALPVRLIFLVADYSKELAEMRRRVLHATPEELEQLRKRKDEWWYHLVPIPDEPDSVDNQTRDPIDTPSLNAEDIAHQVIKAEVQGPAGSKKKKKNKNKNRKKKISPQANEAPLSNAEGNCESLEKQTAIVPKNDLPEGKSDSLELRVALGPKEDAPEGKSNFLEQQLVSSEPKEDLSEQKKESIAQQIASCERKNDLPAGNCESVEEQVAPSRANNDFLEGYDNSLEQRITSSEPKNDLPERKDSSPAGKSNPVECNDNDTKENIDSIDEKSDLVQVKEDSFVAQVDEYASTEVALDIAQADDQTLQDVFLEPQEVQVVIFGFQESHSESADAQANVEPQNTSSPSTVLPTDANSSISNKTHSLPKLDTSISTIPENEQPTDPEAKWDTPACGPGTDDTVATTPQKLEPSFAERAAEGSERQVVKSKKRKSKNKPNHQKKAKGNASHSVSTGSHPTPESVQPKGAEETSTTKAVDDRSFSSAPADDGEGWSIVSRDRTTQSGSTRRIVNNRNSLGSQPTTAKVRKPQATRSKNTNALNNKGGSNQRASVTKSRSATNASSTSNPRTTRAEAPNLGLGEFPPLPSLPRPQYEQKPADAHLATETSGGLSPDIRVGKHVEGELATVEISSEKPSRDASNVPEQEPAAFADSSVPEQNFVDDTSEEPGSHSQYDPATARKGQLVFPPHEEVIAMLLEQDTRKWKCVSPAFSDIPPEVCSEYSIAEIGEPSRRRSLPAIALETSPPSIHLRGSPSQNPPEEAFPSENLIEPSPPLTQSGAFPSHIQFEGSPSPTQFAGSPPQYAFPTSRYHIQFGSFPSQIQCEASPPRPPPGPPRKGPPCLADDPLRDVAHDGKPAGFFWELMTVGFKCGLANCDKRCSSYDGRSVICPGCGPYSETRYCSEEHLFLDVKSHWLVCQRNTFLHPCVHRSVPDEWREGPPMLPNIVHGPVTPEWHRLACREAVDRSADYWIYADYPEWLVAGTPQNEEFARVRCSTNVIRTVVFENEEMRDRFHRVINICIMVSIEVTDLIDYVFRMIRDNLREKGQWTTGIELALIHQMRLEFGMPPNVQNCGQRHACEPEWDGRGRRWCTDHVCSGEYRPSSGHMWSERDLERTVMRYEALYWLLRAARFTHPDIISVEARTRGEGFPRVAPQDRRIFRRGENWDGLGTGVMEIEGVNDHFR